MKPTSMDKAVILARGLGKRMRRADSDASLDGRQQAVAETGIKALIPIGRPFLDYVLSGLADAGYRRVCLVVAPDHEVIRRYYQEEIRPERVSIEFAVQPEPRDGRCGSGGRGVCRRRSVPGRQFRQLLSS